MTALADALAGIVGARWVRTRRAELLAYESDGLPAHATPPRLVVLPGTRDELVACVRLFHREAVPWLPRGAGTGLSGGAVADPRTVVVGLTRLDRILELDPVRRRAVVEPGVVNARLAAAAAPLGLTYMPDPSSQTACTLGGNVAENAGGPHCLKYGVTTNHVTALEVLLADGSTVHLGSPHGEPWGPDLVGLFVGSEGTFGVATSITLRLESLPRAVHTLLAAFDDVAAAGHAVSAIIASGIVPAALEMMDQACVRVVEASIYAAGYPVDAAAVLLVEVDGGPEAAAAEAAEVRQLLAQAGARGVREAVSPAERMALWQGRKKAFGALGRVAPDLMVQDAVVPRTSLPMVLGQIGEIGRRHGLAVSNVFHAGDGNLHPNISFDRRDPAVAERVHAACREIMRACLDAGGSITGEHGVGRDKLEYLDWAFSPEALTLMCDVRSAFDPSHRVNPGKAMPVHYCREWRQAPAARP